MQEKYYPVHVKDFTIGKGNPLTIISGPCAIEDEAHTLLCAKRLKEIMSVFPVNVIFKASYDKANRTSIHSFRGVGLKRGLEILAKVKKEYGFPIITDIHLPEQAAVVAQVADVLQIPAFLCRQTDLAIAAAQTKKPILLKKGQFVAPWDMAPLVEKIRSEGNDQVILCDRGTSFGYNALISDMRAIPVMQKCGVPVCFDASHSVQKPAGLGNVTGGDREFIPMLARCAIVAGADAIFLESHPEPAKAKSDSATVFPLDELPGLVKILCDLYALMRRE